MSMRGLTVFIADIRNCQNKESEEKRVEKEMANIRKKFTSKKGLSSYDRRKYVWKLVYMYVMGYEVDFGHMEVINLLTSPKFNEKVVGYIGTSTLLNGASRGELMTLVTNSVRNDLSTGTPVVQSYALTLAANMGSAEFAESMLPEVQRVLVSGGPPSLLKKAAVCFLRLFRATPDAVAVEEWVPRLTRLLEHPSLGVALSVTTLILGLLERSKRGAEEEVVPRAIAVLSRLVLHRSCSPDYMYYSTPSPWLQVGLMRLLQQFDAPKEPTLQGRLNEVLSHVLSHTDVTKYVNKNNADHAILFEAVNLIIHYKDGSEESLRTKAVALLARFIAVKEPNIRYLGLESMTRLAAVSGTTDQIKKHQSTVMYSLKDADVSIRKRALDLLFVMCDADNAEEVVGELLAFLVVANVSLKEEMILKIAILAERFAPNFKWYLDTILRMITVAGDFVSDDIWHRAVQIISNHEELQKYAAVSLFKSLLPAQVHIAAVKVGAYVLGEYGYLLADEAAEKGAAFAEQFDGVLPTGVEQFRVLHRHFAAAERSTRALLLHTYVKMVNLYPELRPAIAEVMASNQTDMNNEVQQRALEYGKLPANEPLMGAVLEPMPAFPEDRESVLVARLRETEESKRRRAGTGEEEEEEDDDDDAAAAAAAEPEAGLQVREPAAEADLLDLGGDNDAPVPVKTESAVVGGGGGAGGVRGVDPSLAADMRTWFSNLLVSPKGLLYRDSNIEIGVAHEYKTHMGRVMLFLGNKSAGDLADLSVAVDEVPAVRVQVRQEVAVVPHAQQVRVPIMLEAMQPYSDPLVLRVSFTAAAAGGVRYVLPLRLPAMPHSFCGPVPMDMPNFITKWKALEGEERQAQHTFDAGAGGVSVAAARSLVSDQLHLAVVPEMDPSANAVTAAGTFRTGSTTPTGAAIAVGVLLRIEGNPAANKYRVTVRATNGVVAQAIKNVVVLRLA